MGRFRLYGTQQHDIPSMVADLAGARWRGCQAHLGAAHQGTRSSDGAKRTHGSDRKEGRRHLGGVSMPSECQPQISLQEGNEEDENVIHFEYVKTKAKEGQQTLQVSVDNGVPTRNVR